MKAKITIRFGFEAKSKDDLQIINELLCINPSMQKFVFPEHSLAKPSWETEVSEESYEVSHVFQVLQKRIEPKMQQIKMLQQQIDVQPYIMVLIGADFEHRPFVSFSPRQIDFIHLTGAQVIIDLEATYPQTDQPIRERDEPTKKVRGQ